MMASGKGGGLEDGQKKKNVFTERQVVFRDTMGTEDNISEFNSIMSNRF